MDLASHPLEGQPLDKPFAWALIKLDGADTALLHAVAADSPDAISTGARGCMRTGSTIARPRDHR